MPSTENNNVASRGIPFKLGCLHPRWIGPVALSCVVCGKGFQVQASQKQSRKTCSKECRRIRLAIGGVSTRFKPGDPRVTKGKQRLITSNGRNGLKVTVQEFEQMRDNQHGVCAICGNSPRRTRLHIDHDHMTGQVRGLLCLPCNFALGKIERYGDKIKNYLENKRCH